MCRSNRKNKFSPNFKAHLVQEVVLHRDGAYCRVMLAGLNFDTSNDAQPSQVNALKRLLQTRQKEEHFTAIIFGDFNNRLVCVEDQAAAVMPVKAKPGKKPTKVPAGKLSQEGVDQVLRFAQTCH